MISSQKLLNDYSIDLIKKRNKSITELLIPGGKGMAMKKIEVELSLNVGMHFFSTGAVFALKLKNFF